MKIVLVVRKNVTKKDTIFKNPNATLEEQYDFNHPYGVVNIIKLESNTDYDICEFAKLRGGGSSLGITIDYDKILNLKSFRIFINGITHSNTRIVPFTDESYLKQNDILEISYKNAEETTLTHIIVTVTYIAQDKK